jgi:hypothetical protein
MKKKFVRILFLVAISCCISQNVNAQSKPKFLEGSLMIFADGKGKIGFGGVSLPFIKINLHKNLTIGTALAPIIWVDTQKDNHNFGQAGFVIRMDYKKISFGYNILTIAGTDTKFFGIGYKF